MKRFATLIVLMLALHAAAHAQRQLVDSPQRSNGVVVYRLSDDDLRRIHLHEQTPTQQMMHDRVGAYTSDGDMPRLERGNYLLVEACEQELKYTCHTVDSFYARLVPGDEVQLLLTDLQGRIIADARVKASGRKLRYDPSTRTYRTRRLPDHSIIEVDNGGVMHYIDVENGNPYLRRQDRARQAGRRFGRAAADGHSFVVLNKPRYKPGETLRFKAYLADRSRPLTSEIEVHLSGDKDTLLMRLAPYRDGFYEGEFTLDEGLGRRLDRRYPLVLRDSRGKTSASAWFRYEEYQLAAVEFDTRIERSSYAKGEEVGITISVHDENGLPIYDAELEIVMRKSYGQIDLPDEYLFVPDTLWHYRRPLTGRRTQRIVIPDSVFIDGVSMRCELQCRLTDATGEQHRTWSGFTMNRRPVQIVADFNRGIMTLRELHGTESVASRALLTALTAEGETILCDSITLPYTAPVNYMADSYRISSAKAEKEFSSTDYASDMLSCDISREEGGARLRVDNPSGIPFWYTVIRDKSIIDRGYATQLDTLYADSRLRPYALQVDYLLGDQTYTRRNDLPVVQQPLSLTVDTPDKVYPGQCTQVEVEVKDDRGRPVEGADITAYAYTAKFDRSAAAIPLHDKTATARRIVYRGYDNFSLDDHSATAALDYDLWRDRLGLDTIEYYRFLNPDPLYTSTAPARDSITTLMPYVVVDGRLQNIQLLWVDGRLSYWLGGGNDSNPVLRLRPGRHRIRASIPDRVVEIDSIDLAGGVKNIVSVDAGRNSRGVSVTLRDAKSAGIFSDEEYEELQRHVISIEPHFGDVILSGDDTRATLMPMSAALLSGDAIYRLRAANAGRGSYPSPLLVGPVPYRSGEIEDDGISRLLIDTAFVADFTVTGGYRYDIRPGYLSRTSWAQSPISRRMEQYRPSTAFHREVATLESLHREFVEQLEQSIASRNGRIARRDTVDGRCRLEITVDQPTTHNRRQPLVAALFDGSGMHSLYYGGTRRITDLTAGEYEIAVIMRDSTVLRRSIEIRPGGDNYLRFDSRQAIPGDSLTAATLDRLRHMISVRLPEPYAPQRRPHATGEEYVAAASDAGIFSAANLRDGIITGTVYAQDDGMPLIGAVIKAGGTSVATDIDGHFRLPYTGASKMTVSYIGYTPYTVRLSSGHDYRIVLQPDTASLDEVVVTAYGVAKRSAFTGSVAAKNSVADMLYGSAAGIAVEEMAEAEEADNGAAATADGSLAEHLSEEEFAEDWRDGGGLRHDFRDDAFWQPRIATDAEGRARFEVAYPDDITAWNANFIAVGKRSQMAQQQMIIRSTTPVNARLSMPEFAVRGDSITAVGRLTDYLGDTVELWRTIVTDKADSCRITLVDSHVDLIPAIATDADSLTLSYTLRTDEGYFDGERRSIPIVRPGVEAAYGKAVVLSDTLPHTFTPDPSLGAVTIHAEASVADWLDDEIESLVGYRYSCNEQTASKLKAQLARRTICLAHGKRFDGDREVKRLIGLLTDTKCRTTEGLWGWWSSDGYTPWITAHIVEALTAAQQAGYKVALDRRSMADALRLRLDRIVDGGVGRSVNSSAKEMIHTLLTLHMLDPQADCRRYLDAIATHLDDSVDTWIRYSLAAGELCGIPTDREALLARARTSFGGGLYWSDDTLSHRWYAPDDDAIATTLAAYHLLRAMGDNAGELAAIRTWLCERRGEGSWVNTYLSSRIIEAILPDVLSADTARDSAAIEINGRRYDSFPVHLALDTSDPIEVVASGAAPLFVTFYQSGWEEQPQPRHEGFKVESQMTVDGKAVSQLEKGVATMLRVEVEIEADAPYAMIEIPIPAGCSYLSKNSRSNPNQIYRENFKDRAVIFCNRLPQGHHTFTVELLPRYTGRYRVNPAHARLMYYPTIFGRNAMTECRIEER